MTPLNREDDRTCVILPLKPFDDAKERLATGLDAGQRRLLAEAMARDVVAALAGCREVDAYVVISNEPLAAEIAPAAAAVLPDEQTGHSEAAVLGAEWAERQGFRRVVMIPGDCPLLDPEELDDLIARCKADRIEFAVVPDRMGTGTNALVISPPRGVTPAFGQDSRQRHIALGLAAARRTAELEVATLALDLDTADDLMELAERVSAPDNLAVNTEQAVATLLTDRRRLPGGYAR